MQKKWKAFIHKINTKTDDFSVVLNTINVFLAKPYTASIENKIFKKNWAAQNSEWK